ncbi:MAG: hypothetical protein ASARMPREDX12_000946 [Alectoria sarmentosa]|nr:MAG: hypothetical protein ASARMPREDX12_000946 [Alectoria sarmentosa]
MNTNVIQADESVEKESDRRNRLTAEAPPQSKSNASLADETVDINFKDIVTRHKDTSIKTGQRNKSPTKLLTPGSSVSAGLEKLQSKPASIACLLNAWSETGVLSVKAKIKEQESRILKNLEVYRSEYCLKKGKSRNKTQRLRAEEKEVLGKTALHNRDRKAPLISS